MPVVDSRTQIARDDPTRLGPCRTVRRAGSILRGAKIVGLALLCATVGHRLLLQFRPLPKHMVSQRSMTQAEYTRVFNWMTGAVPTNFFMIDTRPYSDLGKDGELSLWDVLSIRALASWGALMPYRTTAIDVWSKTNVSVQVYERQTSQLRFSKDSRGWHMQRVGGQIDWVEGGKPILSFH